MSYPLFLIKTISKIIGDKMILLLSYNHFIAQAFVI